MNVIQIIYKISNHLRLKQYQTECRVNNRYFRKFSGERIKNIFYTLDIMFQER